MTPQQFRAARRELGLSAEQLGRILGVAGRTVRRWERDDGTRPPGPTACRAVGWMLGGYRPPEWPGRTRAPRPDPDGGQPGAEGVRAAIARCEDLKAAAKPHLRRDLQPAYEAARDAANLLRSLLGDLEERPGGAGRARLAAARQLLELAARHAGGDRTIAGLAVRALDHLRAGCDD